MLAMGQLLHDPSRMSSASSRAILAGVAQQSSQAIVAFVLDGGTPSERSLILARAFAASILLTNISDEVRVGIAISVLFAELGSPTRAIEVFAKTHRISIVIVAIRVRNGLAVPACAVTANLIHIMEADEVNGEPDIFVSGVELGELDGCPPVSVRTFVSHVILIATKAITASTVAVANARKRMDAMLEAHPVHNDWTLTSNFADRCIDLIKQSVIYRRALVELVEGAMSNSLGPTPFITAVAHAGGYLHGAGLTGFNMVCRYVVAPKAPILAHATHRAEVETLRGLLKVYYNLGLYGPYIKFLGSSRASAFSPAGFYELYCFALGYAQVINPTMSLYVVNDALTGRDSFHAGRAYAAAGGGSPHEEMATEFGIPKEDLEKLKAAMRRYRSKGKSKSKPDPKPPLC